MKKNGFTLIEVLLYLALASLFITAVSALSAVFLQTRVKNQTIAEVDTQASIVMSKILFTIRNSESINSPSSGSSSSSLSLDALGSSEDPTVFNLSSGALQASRGAGGSVSLTNSDVTVSDLVFENLSRTETPGVIRVEFMITKTNPSARQEFDYSKRYYGTASLR